MSWFMNISFNIFFFTFFFHSSRPFTEKICVVKNNIFSAKSKHKKNWQLIFCQKTFVNYKYFDVTNASSYWTYVNAILGKKADCLQLILSMTQVQRQLCKNVFCCWPLQNLPNMVKLVATSRRNKIFKKICICWTVWLLLLSLIEKL